MRPLSRSYKHSEWSPRRRTPACYTQEVIHCQRHSNHLLLEEGDGGLVGQMVADRADLHFAHLN